MNKYKTSIAKVETQLAKVLENWEKVLELKSEDIDWYVDFITGKFTDMLEIEGKRGFGIRIYRESAITLTGKRKGFKINWSSCGAQDLDMVADFSLQMQAAVDFTQQLEEYTNNI